jgi:DNA-binding GntR family transcriptional regulator
MPIPEVVPDLSRRLAREEVYIALRRWIIAGDLKPGEMLRDQALADSLGVSRTPVREALRRLEDEGFVETARNRWTRVALLNPARAVQSYAVVQALETEALSCAFERIGEDALSEMVLANDRMLAASDAGDSFTAAGSDEQFHRVWLSLSGNHELSAIVTSQKLKLHRIEAAYFAGTARTLDSHVEHGLIIAAIKRGSLADACGALRKHWQLSEKLLKLK